ncbi:uncharacterized protein LOC143035896 [Oratosquilla oratoria]|uniref:uncharacterized protein LOC143035896 n=1 Tax=Oratosquilla oratoria TaxID=337810 RepID=UPI003F762094
MRQGGEEEWLGHPENLTVVKTSPTSVRILWGLRRREDTKYLITYKPVSARYPVISEVVAPERSAVLERLLPYTQYQLYLTTIVNDSVQWTSPVISFHTTTSTTAFDDSDDGSFTSEADAQRQAKDEVEVPEKVGAMQVKAEEIGIVLLVLAMWMFAIALFFNRWGKIRMLEPYQEPYKEQANAQLGHRSSCPMADQYLMINKTMNLGSGDHCMYHTLRRPRQNSVFVGRTRSFSIGEHPPRKVKSALNLTTLVLQEAEEEGGPASSIV